MERAKGRMEIASTLGKGSCFTLVFPDPDHKQELPA
jgi:phosphoglycerate-specific signal transduction histidine kinase